MSKTLTAERLREVLHYDPVTGFLTRKIKLVANASDSENIKLSGRGYIYMHVEGHRYSAHRLAWLHVHGRWPKNMLDHINGNRSDNRISNLREADATLNRENQHAARSDNLSSGVIGVHWSEYHKKWKAHIRVGGRLRHLRYCSTVEEASSVYLAAKRRLHAGCTI